MHARCVEFLAQVAKSDLGARGCFWTAFGALLLAQENILEDTYMLDQLSSIVKMTKKYQKCKIVRQGRYINLIQKSEENE